MLEIVSNGQLKSTIHRVVSKGNSDRSRYSIPFFLHPRPEVILDPQTNLTADDFNSATKRYKLKIIMAYYLQALIGGILLLTL